MKRVITGVLADGRSAIISNEEFAVDSSWTLDVDPGGDVEGWIGKLDVASLLEKYSSVFSDVPGGVRWTHAVIPPHYCSAPHVTPTIDFAVVLDGSVELKMDIGSVILERGDYLIQQACQHSWFNDSPNSVVMMFLVLRPEYVMG